MKKMVIALIVLLSSVDCKIHAQGCVAIRNIAGFSEFAQLGYNQTKDDWVMDINNRYFEAYTFLDGKQNITPKDLKSGVTLYEYTMNIELTRLLKNGWSITMDMPIEANETAGSLEHASGDYHTTHAYGLGDMRFTVYKWLLNEQKSSRGNIQAGLGIKFPTGNYHTEDYFYDDPNDKTYRELLPVNVAIQLGDGGTGITTTLNGYYIFSRHVSIYGNLFYLINPKSQNGVAAWPPNLAPPSVYALWHETSYDVNSVPDSYTTRAGANFIFSNFVATAGMRFEGVPAHDLIGEDDGLRRAGHILSVEPGLQYKLSKSLLYAFVTLPVARQTVKTLPDEWQEAITGTATITPGHFANYVIYVGYTFTF
jgi:hypothetical protein